MSAYLAHFNLNRTGMVAINPESKLFRVWLGDVRQQAITWVNVNPDLFRHLASPGHNELKEFEFQQRRCGDGIFYSLQACRKIQVYRFIVYRFWLWSTAQVTQAMMQPPSGYVSYPVTVHLVGTIVQFYRERMPRHVIILTMIIPNHVVWTKYVILLLLKYWS